MKNEEKGKVITLLERGNSVEDIVTKINKSEKAVRNFINKAIKTLRLHAVPCDGVAVIESKLQAADNDIGMAANDKDSIGERVSKIDHAIKILVSTGKSYKEATDLITRVVQKLEGDTTGTTSEQLANAAPTVLNSQDSIIKQAIGGRDGVAIMTESASTQVNDELDFPKKPKKRVADGVFTIKTNVQTKI